MQAEAISWFTNASFRAVTQQRTQTRREAPFPGPGDADVRTKIPAQPRSSSFFCASGFRRTRKCSRARTCSGPTFGVTEASTELSVELLTETEKHLRHRKLEKLVNSFRNSPVVIVVVVVVNVVRQHEVKGKLQFSSKQSSVRRIKKIDDATLQLVPCCYRFKMPRFEEHFQKPVV